MSYGEPATTADRISEVFQSHDEQRRAWLEAKIAMEVRRTGETECESCGQAFIVKDRRFAAARDLCRRCRKREWMRKHRAER